MLSGGLDLRLLIPKSCNLLRQFYPAKQWEIGLSYKSMENPEGSITLLKMIYLLKK